MKIPESPKPFKVLIDDLKKDDLRLLENEKVSEHIREYNRRYLPWEEYKRRKTPEGISNEKLWTLMKGYRIQGYEQITISGESFSYFMTDDMPQILHRFDKECCGNLTIEGVNIPHDEKQVYLINSLMEEAIASSQMEGAMTTRRIAKQMLRTQRKPKDISEQMIKNNYKTIREIVNNKQEYQVITQEKILNLQAMITKDTLKNPEYVGVYRDNDEIHVGDKTDPYISYHKPPKHTKLAEYMADLCEFINSDKPFIHPMIKAAIIHFLIGYIHPFNDGNGRTARALLYCHLLKNDYWMLQYMPVSRIIKRSSTEYGLSYLYTETDDNDMTYFIKYNLGCIKEALDEVKDYLVKKQRERLEAYDTIYREKDISYRQAQILRGLYEIDGRTIEIREVMWTYGVTYQTARTDLLKLKDLDYLILEKQGRKFTFKTNKEKIHQIKK